MTKKFKINYIFKRVKHLRITIKRDKTVTVSVPLFMDMKIAESFVNKKMLWIKKHLNEITKKNSIEKDLEKVYLWGKPYKKEIIISDKSFCVIQDNTIKIFVKDFEKTPIVLDRFLRKELDKKSQELLIKWQNTTGIYANEMRIKKMKTRWGSCNIRDKRIWLNLRLTHYDTDCLDYVVLHELLHIIESRHNKRFYDLLTRYKSDWKTSKKILNNQL